MSGIDAVKRIVETEAQARRIVEESKSQAQDVISKARQESETVRLQIITDAQRQREEMLARAKEEAETEAAKSDAETIQLIENYRRTFNERKPVAVQKAVELILRGQA